VPSLDAINQSIIRRFHLISLRFNPSRTAKPPDRSIDRIDRPDRSIAPIAPIRDRTRSRVSFPALFQPDAWGVNELYAHTLFTYAFFFEKKTRVRPSWVDACMIIRRVTNGGWMERWAKGTHPPRRGVGRVVSSRARSRSVMDDVDGCGCTYSKGFLGYERFIHRWMGWRRVVGFVWFFVVDDPVRR